MAALFCDASAIVKRYASELGSSWVMGVTDPASGNTIFHTDRIPLGLPPLTLCSADRALNVAALSEGLAVDDPNTHP